MKMQNDCLIFEETCSFYVEDELAESQKHQFEKHLHSCPTCRETVLRLQDLRNHLQSVPPIHASRDFDTILRARIQMTKHVGQSYWATFLDRFKVPVYAVTMTAVIVAILFLHSGISVQEEAIPFSTRNRAAVLPEAEIQPGDIVYSVDIVTLPAESVTLKVSQANDSGISRSMLIPRARIDSDSTITRSDFPGELKQGAYSVSF